MRRLLSLLPFALATSVAAQQASLAGTVLEDVGEKPIAGAEIAIAALNRVVRTDSAGNFTIIAIPAGAYSVTVRALGHEPLREMVTFGAAERVERDYLLARTATNLATVEVKAEPGVDAIRLAEFEDRRKLGLGKFITQDILEKTGGRKLAEVLVGRIPGLRTVPLSPGGTMRGVISTRDNARMGGMRRCFVQIIIDRMIRQPPFDIDTVDPSTLAGVEFFTTSQTPPQFNRTDAPCGTLVIWTRMR